MQASKCNVPRIYKAKLVRVIDGDTIVLNLDLGFDVTRKTTVRLAGIDTNEVHGVKHESAEYAKGKVQSQFVVNLLGQIVLGEPMFVKARGNLEANMPEIVFHSHNYDGKYGRAIGDIYIWGKGYLTALLREEFPSLKTS